MIEIKFRAWDKWDNRMMWVDGSFLDVPQQIASNWKEFLILQQFTGLLDKNGKEIYEGDILSYLDCKGVFVVEWGHWGWRMKGTIPEEDRMISQWGPITLPSGNFEYIEVIGNIYENPDLLTRKDS